MQIVCEVFLIILSGSFYVILKEKGDGIMIKSIILAAGKGTRMKSETPKVLHTIFDKTLVGYVIEAVNGTGIADENFVIVGHQAEKVEEYISKTYNNAKCILQ